MIRTSWTRMASVEETLGLWAASLREIKQRIRPLFKQERVARNVGLFLEGLLGDEQRKTGWMRAEVFAMEAKTFSTALKQSESVRSPAVSRSGTMIMSSVLDESGAPTCA